MATATLPTIEDPWQQIPATWPVYRALVKTRGERSRPKYTYYNGRLTIVSPSAGHEALKTRVGGLIEEIGVTLRIPFLAFGETTFLNGVKPRSGTEPDECYYFSQFEHVRGKSHIIMGQDPPPDLVVEVVATHPLGDMLKVYRRLGVREVWICRRAEVVFLVLTPDGRYKQASTSHWLPFLKSEELTQWAYRDDLPTDSELRYQFRAWVVEVLAPRKAENR